MANMLYNGVPLPDIESVWTDKVTYPYAIMGDISEGQDRTFVSVVLFASYAWVTDGGITALNANGPFINYVVGPTLGLSDWTLNSSGVAGSALSVGELGEDNSNLFWSSVTIESPDGSIYLAASAPVDPNAPTIDLPTVQKWMVVGSALRRLILGRKEATMYSYNGVVLPKLPEWDKSKYPYAAVFYEEGALLQNFIVFTKPVIYKGVLPTGYPWYKVDGTVDLMRWYTSTQPTGSYECWHQTVDETEGKDSTFDTFTSQHNPIIWTNHEIYNEDGTLHLGVSPAPMPVYE